MTQLEKVYPERPCVLIVFDLSDRKQATLLSEFVSSLGEEYAKVANLDLPCHRCLLVYPGGAREVRQ